MKSIGTRDGHAIQLVGFDGDDTLWKSEDYYRTAEAEFEAVLGHYIDLRDQRMQQHLLAVERRNLKIFGYGAKGMTLSMIETAIELTDARISARDIQKVLEIGRATLQHPVEVIAGVREAVAEIAREFEVVLITKGDLFHQERKAPPSRRRANQCKLLNRKDYIAQGRRKQRRSCSPMEPDVSQNCLGFATISGAA